jgi:hypothetical protein
VLVALSRAPRLSQNPSHPTTTSTCHCRGSIDVIQTVETLYLRMEHLVGVLDSGTTNGTRRFAHLLVSWFAHASHTHTW